MNELSKNLMCVQMRSGVLIWMEKERVEKLQEILENITGTKFVNFDNQTINTADIVGIFAAATMEDFTHMKNGQWKCDSGKWHDKNVKCDCPSLEVKKKTERQQEAIAKCGKCTDGFVHKDNVAAYCECLKGLV